MSDATPYKPLPTIATPMSREDRDGFMALSMDEFCSVSSFALIQLLAQRYEATIRKLESAPSLTREAVEALTTYAPLLGGTLFFRSPFLPLHWRMAPPV